MSDTTTPESPPLGDDALMDALWSLVAEKGWNSVTMADLANRAGISLTALRERAETKFHLLRIHSRMVDKAVLADAPGIGSGPPRDRIFDTLMRRIDALQPHREGIIRFGREMRHDPVLALALAPVLAGSMAWMLEAARIESSGLAGILRVKGLSAVWISTLRAWEADESQDLGSTMAALDRGLDKAERVARTLRLNAAETEPPLPPGADIVT